MNKTKIFFFIFICLIGIYLRLYHIEFGLPHSFYADEPEIAEPAIKYTYELRNILSENNWYKLIPVSYVYGTFPVYIFTIATIIFSKTLNIFGIDFDKTDIFIYLRVLNSLITLLIPWLIYALANKLFKNKLIAIYGLIIGMLNWKLLVHAHYLNNDVIQTILITAGMYFAYLYFEQPAVKKYTILGGILFGLAMGTKITSLISLPLIFYLYIVKKDLKGFLIYVFTAMGAFIITNPFSIAFYSDFIYRVLVMAVKEGSIVFDSVDLSPAKYILALAKISHPIIFILSIFAIIQIGTKKELGKFHIFVLGNIAIYLIFFTIQSRRVDRWVLPILPIIIIYASYGIFWLKTKINKYYFYIFAVLSLSSYLYYPYLLTKQFSRYTPKAEAYLWMKENSNDLQTKLVYTEEGLDPMNKLDNAKVKKIEVYPNQNAQLYFPADPKYFDFIILSSRPMQYYKKDVVAKTYPFYSKRWGDFENSLNDTKRYVLIKDFVLSKPNLIPLSDVFIYQNLNPEKFPTNSNY